MDNNLGTVFQSIIGADLARRMVEQLWNEATPALKKQLADEALQKVSVSEWDAQGALDEALRPLAKKFADEHEYVMRQRLASVLEKRLDEVVEEMFLRVRKRIDDLLSRKLEEHVKEKLSEFMRNAFRQGSW